MSLEKYLSTKYIKTLNYKRQDSGIYYDTTMKINSDNIQR